MCVDLKTGLFNLLEFLYSQCPCR